MATIEKRQGKNGVTYRIRSSCGYDVEGRQVMRSMTWRPEPGMKPKAIEKELKRQAVLFEEQCKNKGQSAAVKFETFARQWFIEYAEKKLRPKTLARLHQHEARTYKAIGHIRLDKLTARHIQEFINNLQEEGISTRGDKAHSEKLPAALKAAKMTQKELATKAKIGCSTASTACRGGSVTIKTAKAIAQVLQKDMKTLFEVEKSKDTLSPKTARNYHSFVSAVLSYAVKMDILSTNPASRVTLPPMEQKEKEVYTIEEAQTFIERLTEAPLKYQAFCILAIYGSFRRSELLGLEWSDIDFDNRIVTVRRTSQYTKEKGVFTDTTKTKKSQRSLKLPAGVFAVLRQHKAAQSAERLAMGDRWHDNDRLFVDAEGNPMHPNTPYRWLKQFCEATGQRFLGIHQFRHLNATLLINSGTDARTVSSALGHSQVSTTLNIYTHTFAEAQARAGEALADVLEKKVGSA